MLDICYEPSEKLLFDIIQERCLMRCDKDHNIIPESSRDRRNFIKSFAAGAAGLAASGPLFSGITRALPAVPERSDVAFTTGTDRREMMAQVLKPFEKEIREGMRGRQVVLKVNLVGPDLLSGVHVDAVRGVLDVIAPLYGKRIIVGDSTGRTYPGPMGTWKHFDIHKYLSLPDEYNVKLLDLNDRPSSLHWIVGQNCRPQAVRIIDTFLDPDVYLISLTRLKTHGDVVATLSTKNIMMGAPISHYKQKKAAGRNEKSFMHSGGVKNINFNIFLLAQKIRPQLSIVDGLVGMEGNGPTLGTSVEHGIALAGLDMLAVDRIGVELMGIDFDDVGYLTYCAQAGLGQSDISKIRILGPGISSHVRKYKLHENIEWQLTWKDGLAIDR